MAAKSRLLTKMCGGRLARAAPASAAFSSSWSMFLIGKSATMGTQLGKMQVCIGAQGATFNILNKFRVLTCQGVRHIHGVNC